MQMVITLTATQAKRLIQYCEKEAKDAYFNHCARRQADGIESLFDADLQESQAREAQLAIDWHELGESIKKQNVEA